MGEQKNIEIKRSKRKSLSLEITDTARIIVRAPNRLSESAIVSFINKNTFWLEKKHSEALTRLESIPRREFAAGETLMYLGVSYPLFEQPIERLAFKGVFEFPVQGTEKRKKMIETWYKKQARAEFTKRIALFTKTMDVSPKRLRITSAQKRWGSCSSQGTISLTWRLVMAPPHIIDYVIVHELAHLKHMNHSKRFWDKVGKHLPKHKEAKKWLVDYGHILVI